MPSIGTLIVNFAANITGLQQGMSQAMKDVKALGEKMQGLGAGMTLGITAPIVALGTVAVQAATDLDSLKRGLTAVAGSSEKANEQLTRLEEVAKLPGLGFKEAIEGSTRLQAAGLSAKLAERSLMGFGNALATVGGGKADLDTVTRALSQMAAKGKVSAEEIGQLAEKVPQIREIMKAAYGTADAEKLGKAGIQSMEFIDGIVKELERLPRVTAGAQNSFENFSDAVFRARGAIGEALLPAVLPLVDNLTALMQKVRELDPDTVRWGIAIAGVAAVAGPLVIVLGGLAIAVSTLATAIGVGLLPLILVGGPVLLGLGALAALILKTKLDSLAAAGAIEAFKGSLIGLTEVDLIKKKIDFGQRVDELTAEGERLKASRPRPTPTLVSRLPFVGKYFPQQNVDPLVAQNAAALAEAKAKFDATTVALERLNAAEKELENNKPVTLNIPDPKAANDLATFLNRINRELSAIQGRNELEDLFGGGAAPEYAQGAIDAVLQTRESIRDLMADIADFERKAKQPAPAEAYALLTELQNQASKASLDLMLARSQYEAFGRRGQPDLGGMLVTRDVTANEYGGETARDRILRQAEALRELREEIEFNKQAWLDSEEAMETFLSVGRGLEGVIRRIGLLNGTVADVVGSVLDLVSAFNSVAKAGKGVTGLNLSAADFGTVLSGGVGVAAAGVSLYQQFTAENPEHTAAIEANNRELARVALELSGFRASFETQTQALKFLSNLPDDPRKRVAAFKQGLPGSGLTKDQLVALAESQNIKLLDSKGKIIHGALEQLEQRLKQAALSVKEFGKTMEGQRALQDARREIEDRTDPGAVLADEYALLLRGLNDQTEKAFGLSGLDLTTTAGQDALNKALTDLWKSFEAGDLSALDLSGFESVEEFIAAMTGTDRALDSLAETANKATDALRNAPAGFAVAQARFDAALAAAGAAPAPTAAPPTSSPRAPEPSEEERWKRGGSGGGTGTVEDKRTYNITFQQQPGESMEAFSDRVLRVLSSPAGGEAVQRGRERYNANQTGNRTRAPRDA